MSKTKKIITMVTLISIISTFAVGCGNDTPGGDETTATTETSTTTKEEVSTKDKETATEEIITQEITTEEPTTVEKIPLAKYPYKGKMFLTFVEVKDYFDGFIVNPGDKIYLNEIWPGDSDYDNHIRGEIALSLHVNFGVKDETIQYEKKYLSQAGALVPYSDNYFIEYKGKKIQFIYVGFNEPFEYFDMITIE